METEASSVRHLMREIFGVPVKGESERGLLALDGGLRQGRQGHGTLAVVVHDVVKVFVL